MLEKNNQSNKSKIIWQSEEEGELKQYLSEPEVSMLRKLKVYFFALLPIEHLL